MMKNLLVQTGALICVIVFQLPVQADPIANFGPVGSAPSKEDANHGSSNERASTRRVPSVAEAQQYIAQSMTAVYGSQIESFARVTDAAPCAELIQASGEVSDLVLRFDFTLQPAEWSPRRNMIACVDVPVDGARSWEFFPASLGRQGN